MAVVKRKMSPAPLAAVTIADDFWAPRIRTNRKVTLQIEYAQCKKTGRIDAFKLQWKPGAPNPPHIFWDSDVAKWIEAVCYSLTTQPDPQLAKLLDTVVDLVVKAQQPDGYLNCHFTVVEPDKRWTNLRDLHELYCAGHLMEAAVAHYHATGKRKLLDALCRYADHIDSVFGREKGKKRGYPGHEEIELALVKLYHVTGNARYLKLSKYFIDERGRQHPHYYDVESKARGQALARDRQCARPHAYCQAHAPVREQRTAEGHAVRAMYLFSGMADVAAETGDRTLQAACEQLWKNVTERRMYITGAIGSSGHGESFSGDYDLPSETAYAESCANIGLVFFAHRMLQLTGEAQYADTMERALYNSIPAGVALDGRKFFYANPLNVFADMYDGRPGLRDFTRQEWFSTACCPPNIARLLASLGRYVYSSAKDAAWVHLYVQGSVELPIGKQTVRLTQQTKYPWGEKVRIVVAPERPGTFTLYLRLPGWCRAPELRVAGRPVNIRGISKKGYAVIHRAWKPGDVVELRLPMPVERVMANPKVWSNRAHVALQRGPVVYCLEETDNGTGLERLALPLGGKLTARFDPRLFGGVTVITGKALRYPSNSENALYRPAAAPAKVVEFKAIPYCLWNNRAPGAMMTWLPVAPGAA